MTDLTNHLFSRLAARVDKLVLYVRRPHLWRLHRQGVGLECYLKLQAPFLQNAGYRTVLDIGANIGQFALAARAAFPDARLYSFEPLPDCFEQLQRNLVGTPSFQAFNCGLGSQEGELEFERSEFSASSSFLRMASIHRREFPATVRATKVKVAVRRLDDMAAALHLAEPMLAKIDVQGYEREVLRGGERLLRRAQTIILESSLETLYESQPLFNEVHQALVGLGFRYAGNFDQVSSPIDGRILQVDGIYQRQGPDEPFSFD